MILKGKDNQKGYEPYDKILKDKCSYISEDIETETLSKLSFHVERYLCPCGMVKVTKGPGQRIKIESDVCGFN
jgi:hypothetical protein